MKMIDRIKKYQQRSEESVSQNNFSNDDNVFFDFTPGDHRVRLVGDWTVVHSHWIGPSKFSKVAFYDEDSFKGDERLKKTVNCPDFDVDTETSTEEKTCTICKLRAAANDLIYECKDLDAKQKKYLENIAYEAFPNERVFFLCIDRDNPEISEGKKGFKIIEFPKALTEQWIKLVEENEEVDPNSEDEGIDFIISKKKEGNKNKYTIHYAMKGAKACQTPLTDEEKAYPKPDIKKIMCKMPDQDSLFEKLLPEFKELIEDSDEGKSNKSDDKKSEKVSLPKRQKPENDDSEYESEGNEPEDQDDDDENVPF